MERRPDAAGELVPHVDDVSLVNTVSGVKHVARHDVPGAYAGAVLDHVRVGDLAAHLTWQLATGTVALLVCDCEEVAYWPLEARVST
ncbi:hypothetical protein [Micromonospora sp. NPDC005237]|uniref:hypothetical protein n=1 Tax=Micromonospora sp. NPDC005237 TaxID=3155113 RepID=UPI0033B09821